MITANKNKNSYTEERNINYKSTTKVPLLVDQHCSTQSKFYVQPFRGLANPVTPSYITVWNCGTFFSGGTEIAIVGLVAACSTVCSSVFGSTSMSL